MTQTRNNSHIPSHLPVNVTRKSYQYMMNHCTIQNGVFVCRTGARVKARMVMMQIYDRATVSPTNYVSVATLYCDRCDDIPATHKGDAIYEDELVTLAL